jgi:hypothetical protein
MAVFLLTVAVFVFVFVFDCFRTVYREDVPMNAPIRVRVHAPTVAMFQARSVHATTVRRAVPP